MNKEQLIEDTAKRLARLRYGVPENELNEMEWRYCMNNAKQILLGHGLAMIYPENDWKVNPFEEKWLKSYGGDIDHYRDLMDGYNRCREYIIPLEEVE